MRIEELKLINFRNCRKREYHFDSSRIIFSGLNGVGKSNLLEAIGFLSVLRSFRGASPREMVMLGEREFTLAAKIDCEKWKKTLALRESVNGGRELYEDRHAVRRSSEFIRNFRTVIFAPEDRMIISGGASYRRRFLDMLISVLEGKYFSALNDYNRALKQRNKALREGGAGAEYFNGEIVTNALILSAFRRNYCHEVEREVNLLLGGGRRFEINCRFSAPENEADFRDLLIREREKELRRGSTLYGSHLDDFIFIFDEKPLRICGSTGQIRLLSLFIKLAEFSLVRRLAELPVLVLADDVTCELDADNARRFFELTAMADQSFFTFAAPPRDEFFSTARNIVLKSTTATAAE